MYQSQHQTSSSSKSEPLLPLHEQTCPSTPPASFLRSSRRRPRRSLTFNSPCTGNRIRRASVPLRSSTFRHAHQPSKKQQQQYTDLAQQAAATCAPACGTSSPQVARIHSGSAVAGFVVGTTFEACLMGWLACLHVKGAADDPPLFCALVALFLMTAWSTIFHFVLWHMDALVDMAPVGQVVSPFLLYSHFNGGLALGLGLECTILHHILRHKSQAAAAVLMLASPDTWWGLPLSSLGLVSIVFGLGCVGLTLLRTYYTPGGQRLRSSSSKRTPLLLDTAAGSMV